MDRAINVTNIWNLNIADFFGGAIDSIGNVSFNSVAQFSNKLLQTSTSLVNNAIQNVPGYYATLSNTARSLFNRVAAFSFLDAINFYCRVTNSQFFVSSIDFYKKAVQIFSATSGTLTNVAKFLFNTACKLSFADVLNCINKIKLIFVRENLNIMAKELLSFVSRHALFVGINLLLVLSPRIRKAVFGTCSFMIKKAIFVVLGTLISVIKKLAFMSFLLTSGSTFVMWLCRSFFGRDFGIAINMLLWPIKMLFDRLLPVFMRYSCITGVSLLAIKFVPKMLRIC